MRLQQTFTMFFLVGLLPIFIHGFDSYLQSLSGQQFAFTVPHATNIGAVEITRIGSVRRACPTTKKAINENGIPLVEVGACLGVTDVAVSLPKLSVTASIAQARFDVSMKIDPSLKQAPRVTLSVPVWEGIEVEGTRVGNLNNRSFVAFVLQRAINTVLRQTDWTTANLF
uniref:BPI1 domain-containing protein n=1 Tax=Mesocestoides corti TaxID=53468 RepID=A0A5K3F934_MESCO